EAWGSALGGVINIITKAAGTSEKANGTLQASYGERETVDLGAELFGKKGGLGYYLSARGLETDGFNPENDRLNRNFFAKLSYGLFEDASIEGALMYNKNSGGVGLFTDWGVYDRDRMESLLSNLSLKSKIGAEMDMELSLKYAKGDWSYGSYLADTREPDPWFFPVETDNERYSASARLEWNPWRHSVVAGIDYEYGVVRSNAFDEDKLTLSKYAVFLNDTIIIGNLTVIPGLRLDDTDETDMFVSPSLGLVYELRPDTLLRLYVARGFNDPQIADLKGNSNWADANPNLGPETVWSYQAGVETGILKHFWLKVSAFDHEIRDEIAYVPSTTSPGERTSVNIGKSRRRGLEAEMKTASFHKFVFSAAASIIRAKDLETDEEVKGVPTSTVDLGLSYDDNESIRGSLNGHSVMWNEESYYEGRYNAMIFDLHLIKSIIRHGGVNVEVFATGHNIFNGAQYWTTPFINAGRWIEAGLRMKF
ncbi:MAG: TonB-dependent receptor, partial [Nitrospirota bacterium]|nr:TonB-dependent receptor [Nitrospirota bacterium]